MASTHLTNVFLHMTIFAVIMGLFHVTCNGMVTLSSGMKITNHGNSEQDTEIMKLTDDVKVPKNITYNRRINCGMKEILKNESTKIPPRLERNKKSIIERLPYKKCVKIEYLFVLESGFMGIAASNTFAIENYISSLMNEVQRFFDTLELNIKVSTIGIIHLTKENERYLAPYIQESSIPYYPNALNYKIMIANMGKFYCATKNVLARKADIIMLITERRLASIKDDGSLHYVAGVAHQVGEICDQCKKCAIGARDNSFMYTAHIVAHESAHLLGCMHDGAGPEDSKIPYSPGALNCPYDDGYIMGSGDANSGKFSSCCKRNVEHLLNSGNGYCIAETCNH